MSATRNSLTYVTYRCQQSLSHYITCQDTCVQQLHAAKRILPYIFADLLPCYCCETKTSSTVEQFAREFRNYGAPFVKILYLTDLAQKLLSLRMILKENNIFTSGAPYVTCLCRRRSGFSERQAHNCMLPTQ